MKHSHSCFCISAIKEKELKIQIDHDTTYTLESDQLALFNPDQLHKIEPIDKSITGYYQIYLDKNWCTEIQKTLFIDLEVEQFVFLDISKLDHRVLYEEFINLCDTILKEKRVRTYEKEIKKFISFIFKNYCKNTNDIEDMDKYKNILENSKKLINKNLDTNISLEDIISHTNYSKSFIINLFKEHLGQTPKAYIINQKINKAKKLIVENDNKSLNEIANEVGFNNQSHFNKNFKRIYGIVPFSYRP